MESGSQKKNLRISGYMQLERGWQVSVEILGAYGRNRKVIVGSTLSILHVSKASLFPGVLLKHDYEYLYLNYPSYSAAIVDWNEINEGSAFPTSEGMKLTINETITITVTIVITIIITTIA